MRKNLLLTLALILCTTLCQAFELDVSTWTDFEGTLGKTNIELSLLRFENGKIKGNYCYRKYDRNDKAAVSSHVSYPVNVTIGKQQNVKIKNKQSLIANFDQIFTPEFKEAIRLSRTCNLFYNYQGAMLSDGKIWIYNKPGSTKEKYGYRYSDQ